MNICVFGASSSELEPIYYAEAERLGRLMARQGFGLVFGGGREGLMGAVARGVHAEGGEITGIAPKFFDEPGILYEHCTRMIYTETMRERKKLMEDNSEAFIVLPGGIGTFEEFFEILTLKQLGRSDRAIAVLNTNGCYLPLQRLLENTAEHKFMSKACLGLYLLTDTPEKALEYVKNYTPKNAGSVKRLSDYSK